MQPNHRWQEPPPPVRVNRAERPNEATLSAEAEKLYREVLALAGRGQREEAMARYAQANAINATTQRDIALRLRQQGRLAEAAARYRKVLALQPNFPQAHQEFGEILNRLGRPEEAAQAYRAAGGQPPEPPAPEKLAQEMLAQGIAHHTGGRLEEAIACLRRALELKPEFFAAADQLGVVLMRLQRPEEAAAYHRLALALDPEDFRAHIHLGIALAALRRPREALVCQRHALRLCPDSAEAHSHLALALDELGRAEEALEWHRRAVALQPDNALFHVHLGVTLLRSGELAAGWQEREWRWRLPELYPARGFVQPQWRGAAASGQTLLIHPEGGAEDMIQFCRFAPLAAALGLQVCIEAAPELVRLLQSVPGVAQVVAAGAPLPPFDLHCPVQSLPAAFDTVPADVPYLYAEPERVAAWAARLPAPGARRIGLAWAGERQVIAPVLLAPLFAVAETSFFSLHDTDGFADAAGMIANLDLVIAVDGALAHLAGALGKPVWLLAPADGGWRWPRKGRETPWYTDMRIFRQPAPGLWEPVIAEVAGALAGKE